MSLATGISALATSVGAALKALAARVTALEANPVIVPLTQTEYDALSPPDANTQYVITGA